MTALPSDFNASLASDLIEVLKYPLKFGAISIPDNWHAEQILAGRRLRGSFGSLYGLGDAYHLTDYADRFEGSPYEIIAARWMGDEYAIVDPEVTR